jgi:GNAT superfamily N-acetyltransferase
MAVLVRSLGVPGDLGWVVMAHGEVYAAEFGWDATFEQLVARIVAGFADRRDPARDAAWIAEVDGRRAGCVFCVGAGPGIAKLRILLVDPAFRGHGLGARLVGECLSFATAAGYRRVTLWTNDVLTSARKIYQAAGFTLDDEEPHDSFGARLVGQNWSRDLP